MSERPKFKHHKVTPGRVLQFILSSEYAADCAEEQRMRVAGVSVHPRTSREPGLVTVMEDCVYVAVGPRGARPRGGAELESPRQRSVGHARCRGSTADESLGPRMRRVAS